RGIALLRKNHSVISLHAPVVGEIQDIVRRADDDCADVLILHQGAYAIQLRLILGPSHDCFPGDSVPLASMRTRTLMCSHGPILILESPPRLLALDESIDRRVQGGRDVC